MPESVQCEVIIIGVTILLIVLFSFQIHRIALVVRTNINECYAVLNQVAVRHLTGVIALSQSLALTICTLTIRQNQLGFPQTCQVGVVVRNAQTNIVTILVPFSVEEFLSQIQGLCCTILHICALCTSVCLIRSFTSCQITCRNTTTCCIVNQSVCQRRYASEVAIAIANDGCLQVGIFLICACPRIRFARPDQAGRNREACAIIGNRAQIRNFKLGLASAICCMILFIIIFKCDGSACLTQNGVVEEPACPLVQNGFQSSGQIHAANSDAACIALCLNNIVQFSQTLNSPYLVTDPVVRTWVSINRVFYINHLVEFSSTRCILAVFFITTIYRVGATTSDYAIIRQQPQVVFHLCLEGLLEVFYSTLCLHVGAQVGVICQCVSSQRVLVEFVCVRATDLPCPRTIQSTAPRGIPVHQVILTIAVGTIPLIGCTNGLVVLIEHVVSGFVTHLSSQNIQLLRAAPLGVNALIRNAPSVCSVYSLNCTVFCVRCVGVRILLSNLLFGVEEALHTADTSAAFLTVLNTKLQFFYASMRNGFPARFLFTTLESIDHGERTAYVLLLVLRRSTSTKAIPVIYVSQPVHQVQALIAAVCTCEVLVNRVYSVVALQHISRIQFDLFPFIAVGCTQLLLLHDASLCIRNQSSFHGLPSLCGIANAFGSGILFTLNGDFALVCLIYDVITHCCGPYQVGQSFRSGFMTVVRSFDTEGFNRVIRYTQTAANGRSAGHIAILNTVCDYVIIQRHEPCCIGAVTVCFCLCSGTSCGSSSRNNCTACHCSSKNRCQNSFVLLKLHGKISPFKK